MTGRTAAKRLLASGTRSLWVDAATAFADAGLGPSTSYSAIWAVAGCSMPGGSPAGLRRLSTLGQQLRYLLLRAEPGSKCKQAARHELGRQWRQFKSAALVNSLTISQPGQNLLAAVVPPALLYLLMPHRFHTYAYEVCSPEAYERRMQRLRDASRCSTPQPPSAVAAALASVAAALAAPLRAIADEALIALRAVYLGLLFLPAMVTAPLVVYLGIGRTRWLNLLRWTLERSGPAWIKWGQWASTRPDLFPEDVCECLEQLQTSAPSHAAAASVAAVERAFGPLSDLFSEFDPEPVASGSIAQIHRAVLSARGAARVGVPDGTTVAVKVRHPRVSDLMHRDFVLMQRAAAVCSALPALRELRLEESIRQFGGPLHEQLDLSVEASHLARFNANFRAWPDVSFPVPLFPLVSPDVLVESFEEGALISRYVRSKHRHNVVLANVGVSLFLKMMLNDNFIHADLHPGNILVKEVGGPSLPPAPAPPTAQTQPLQQQQQQVVAQASAAGDERRGDNHASGRPAEPTSTSSSANGGVSGLAVRGGAAALGLVPAWALGWLRSHLPQRWFDYRPKIVLLDTGMIVELSEHDQHSVLGFFRSLTKMDGEGLGDAILRMAVGETCKDPDAFRAAIADMYRGMDRDHLRLQSQAIMRDMLECMRQHGVTLRSSVSTVVVTSLVLEGWSMALDPEIRILEMVRDMLATDWADRISLVVDKVMASGALAMA